MAFVWLVLLGARVICVVVVVVVVVTTGSFNNKRAAGRNSHANWHRARPERNARIMIHCLVSLCWPASERPGRVDERTSKEARKRERENEHEHEHEHEETCNPVPFYVPVVSHLSKYENTAH